MSGTIVYVGSGWDIFPLISSQYNRYVFIEALPKKITDPLQEEEVDHGIHTVEELKNIIERYLHNYFEEYELIIDDPEKNQWVWNIGNNQAELIFYYNTIFPDDLTDDITAKIKNASALWVAGCKVDPSMFEIAPGIRKVYFRTMERYLGLLKGVPKKIRRVPLPDYDYDDETAEFYEGEDDLDEDDEEENTNDDDRSIDLSDDDNAQNNGFIYDSSGSEYDPDYSESENEELLLTEDDGDEYMSYESSSSCSSDEE